MSRRMFNRTRRGTPRPAGRHVRPATDAVLPAAPWPQVPAEPQPTDFGFPRVTLPLGRPAELRAAATAAEPLAAWEQELLDSSAEPDPVKEAAQAEYNERLARSLAAVADDDTVSLERVPADAAGVPVPSTPFLTAEPGWVHEGLVGPGAAEAGVPSRPTTCGAIVPRTACTDVRAAVSCPACIAVFAPAEIDAAAVTAPMRVVSALPAQLTAAELMLLGRPVTDEAPAAATAPPRRALPVRRGDLHPAGLPSSRVFAAFDAAFWDERNQEIRALHADADALARATDAGAATLDALLARTEAAHQKMIELAAPHEYRGRLADAIRPMPLPHRTPGAAKAAVDADAAAWHDEHPDECCPDPAGCAECPLPAVTR